MYDWFTIADTEGAAAVPPAATKEPPPLIYVCGDRRISHFIIEDPGETADFGWITDYYMPGGAYVLKGMLEAIRCHGAATWSSESCAVQPFWTWFIRLPGASITPLPGAQTAPGRIAILQERAVGDPPFDVDSPWFALTDMVVESQLGDLVKRLFCRVAEVTPSADSAMPGVTKDQIDAFGLRIEKTFGEIVKALQPIEVKLLSTVLRRLAFKHGTAPLPRDTLRLTRVDRHKFGPKGCDEVFREPSYHAARETSRSEPLDDDYSIPTRKPRVVLASIDFDGWGINEVEFAKACCGDVTLLKLRDVDDPAQLHKRRGASTEDTPKKIRRNIAGILERSCNSESEPRTIVVISADELRQKGLRISYQVSWERTIQSLISALQLRSNKDDPYYHLLLADRVVVTFGCDAAMYMEIRRQVVSSAYFVADPSTNEGDFVKRHGPRVRGFDSIISCALAHALSHDIQSNGNSESIDKRIVRGLIRGLKATRFLQLHGFTHVPDVKAHDRLFSKTNGDRLWQNYSPWLYCGHLINQLKGVELRKNPFPDRPVMFPFDLIAAIIHDGNPHRLSWYPFAVVELSAGAPAGGRQEDTLDDLRALGARIEDEWRSSGWFQCLRLSRHMLDRMRNPTKPRIRIPGKKPLEIRFDPLNKTVIKILGKVIKGQPFFDRSWWSLLEYALSDRMLGTTNAKPGREERTRIKQAKESASALAHTVLIHGLGWLRGNPIAHNQRKIRPGLVKARMKHLNKGERVDAILDRMPLLAQHESVLRLLADLPDASGVQKAVLVSTLEAALRNVGDDSVLANLKHVLKNKEWESQSWDDALVDWVVGQRVGDKRREWPNLLGVIPYISIGDYSAIDRREAESLRGILQIVQAYLDGPRAQPLNLGVFGPPGSGKSFAVRQVCEKLEKEAGSRDLRFRTMTFNLSQFGTATLLTEAFEEIQDAWLQKRIPVVFWDEYDTALDGEPLGWLRYFLGPMNDGIYFRDERIRKLPPAVFVFAGSMFTSYMSMNVLHEMAAKDVLEVRVDRFSPNEWRAAKGSDFKSRLTGTLDVLGVNPVERVRVFHEKQGMPVGLIASIPAVQSDEFSYYVRRALVLRWQLWERRNKENADYFSGKDLDSAELRIDPDVARAFIQIPTYLHGARSIEQIVKMSSMQGCRTFGVREMPDASQLRLHVDASKFEGYYIKLDGAASAV